MKYAFDATIIGLIQGEVDMVSLKPLLLGGAQGPAGGVGGPPGGYIGRLPQWRVAYDQSEQATLWTVGSGIPPSGLVWHSSCLPSGLLPVAGVWPSGYCAPTLWDNLNHIRARIAVLEASGISGSGISAIGVELNGIPEGSGNTLNFIEGSNVTIAVTDMGNTIDIQFDCTASGVVAWGQVVTVMKSGGDYTNLTSAMAAIVDASSTKPYTILVGPGVYEFNQYIQCKDWVSVVGMGTEATIFKPTGLYSNALRIKCASHAQYMDFSIINTAISFSGTYLLWGLEIDEIASVRVTNVYVEYVVTTTDQAEVGGVVATGHPQSDIIVDHCVCKVTHTTGTTLSRTYAFAAWGSGVLFKDCYGYAATAGFGGDCNGIDVLLDTPSSGTGEITIMGCIGEALTSTSMGIGAAIDRSTGAGTGAIRIVDCIGRGSTFGCGLGTSGSTGTGLITVVGGAYQGSTNDIALYDGVVLANEPTAYPQFYAVQYDNSYGSRLPIYLGGDRLAGKLDWDDVWADAVHNHSSDAEGGNTLSLASLGVTNNITVGGTVDGVDVGAHVAAAAPHSGHVQIGGQLGGTAASPDVRGLRETGGPTLLTMGAVESRKFLQRSETGNTIIGGAPVLYAYSTMQQQGFATDTYLEGSVIAIPSGTSLLLPGTRYHLIFDVSKTAAGTATPIIRVRFGTNGTTADAAILTFTFLAQTAAADIGTFEVWAVFEEGGSANETLQGRAQARHRLQITGLQNLVCTTLQVTSGAFDSTVANSYIGVSVNAGASAVWTVELVEAELVNLR